MRRCANKLERRRQAGWGAAEYLAVLLGLMIVWNIAQVVLTRMREHHDEFSWALMIPF
jgi:hypothetical protein